MTHLRNLTESERERLQGALSEASATSHARFIFSVVPAADHYRLYPVLWGAVIALGAMIALAVVQPQMGLTEAVSLQAGLFVILSLILEWRPLRLFTVPAHIKRAHASQLAYREFAARILSHGGHGVLLFVAEAERYAELLADAKTHALVGEAEWNRIVASFAAQMRAGKPAEAALAAVTAIAGHLAEHFPKAG